MFPRSILILPLFAILLTTACGSNPALRSSPITNKTTTFISATIIGNLNTSDPANPHITFVKPDCSGTTCIYHDNIILDHTIISPIGTPTSITTRNNLTLSLNHHKPDGTLSVSRLLGRSEHAAFGLHRLLPPANKSNDYNSIHSLASGTLLPPAQTHIPPGTWTGTAAFQNIFDLETYHLSDATFLVPPLRDNPNFPRYAKFTTSQPEPFEHFRAAEPPSIDPFFFFSIPIHHQLSTFSKGDNHYNIQGSFHGPDHNSLIIVFSNVRKRINGAAILHRQDPPDNT